MGFLKKLIGVALPVIGGAVAGPAGAAIGGTLGTAVSKGISEGSSAVGSLIGGMEQASAAREATDLAYERNSAEAALQRNWASQEASTARQFNELQAQKQMDFQERLSSSAHQREVADLRAAGLNPILSGTGGMGSATPVGASAHASAPSGSAATSQAQQVFDIITPALSTAMNLSLARAEIAKKEAEVPKISAEAALIRAQEATEKWGPENRKWATELLSAQFNKTLTEKQAIELWQRKLVEAQERNYEATTKLINEKIRSARTKAELDEAFGELERIIGVGGSVVDSVTDIAPPTRVYKRALR